MKCAVDSQASLSKMTDWLGFEANLWAWKDHHRTAFIVSYSELINGIMGYVLLHLIKKNSTV